MNVEDLFEVENAVNNALGVTDGRLESRLPGESLNLTSQALQVLNHAQRSLLNLQQDLLREAAEELLGVVLSLESDERGHVSYHEKLAILSA